MNSRKKSISRFKQLFIAFVLLSFSVNPVTAQRKASDTILATPWISVSYSVNGTAGDLQDRYGLLNNLGFFAGYKTKRNWIFGIEGNFIFGNRINVVDLFNELTDSKGNITDENGDIATVRVLARGFNVNGSIGKILYLPFSCLLKK